jgi:hypothetical protein
MSGAVGKDEAMPKIQVGGGLCFFQDNYSCLEVLPAQLERMLAFVE